MADLFPQESILYHSDLIITIVHDHGVTYKIIIKKARKRASFISFKGNA